MEEKQQDFQEEIAGNTVNFPELLHTAGTVDTEMDEDLAGAKVIVGWEHLVENTASKVIGEKPIVCYRAHS